MSKDLRELTPEEAAQIAGGYVVSDEKQNRFWLVKQDGSVLAPAPSLEKAQQYAKSFTVSPTVMTVEEYRKHFGRDLDWKE